MITKSYNFHHFIFYFIFIHNNKKYIRLFLRRNDTSKKSSNKYLESEQ